MSNKSNAQSASKRLLQELKSYQEEPNPALLSLGPDSDDDLFRWTAQMKGHTSTAYEGKTPSQRPRHHGTHR